MFKIAFVNCYEIRMGSPFNICDLEIDSEWRSLLPEHDWQDKIAYSPDQRFIGLVRWDTRGNEPGFRIIILDTETKQRAESPRIDGCCDHVSWGRSGVAYRTFDGFEWEFNI